MTEQEKREASERAFRAKVKGTTEIVPESDYKCPYDPCELCYSIVLQTTSGIYISSASYTSPEGKKFVIDYLSDVATSWGYQEPEVKLD